MCGGMKASMGAPQEINPRFVHYQLLDLLPESTIGHQLCQFPMTTLTTVDLVVNHQGSLLTEPTISVFLEIAATLQ